MHKLTKGKVPPLHLDVLDEEDKTLLGKFATTKEKVETLIEQYKFRDALVEIIDLARSGNGYLQKKQPWKLADKASPNPSKGGALEQNNLEVAGEKHGFQNPPLDGREALEAQKLIDNCLHICLQLTANITILIHPFLPNTASKLCYMLKVVEKMLEWENAGKTKLLSVGYNLREPQILFRKIEQSEIDAQIEKLKVKSKKMQDASDKAQATTSLPNLSEGGALVPNNPEISEKNHGSQNPLLEGREAVKPEIVFDDFAKIDLKVGTIVAAEKVEKADKLLKLSVDLGFETRTIVSGIALHFKPEEIVGKQVTVVCNLAPRKMRGIESNGMILMAENADGKLHFINPEEKISAGAGVS
jgi:methionyl-tRNA synthetase